MDKKNLILNRILDEIFDACKQCVIDNYEEDEKEFKKLISFLHDKLHSWYEKGDKYINVVN